MVWLFQIGLIFAGLFVLVGGPYFGARYVAILRGKSVDATTVSTRRNVFGLRSEPRFYGLLAIFVATLPALFVSLVALGAYVPAAQDRVLSNLIEARLSTPNYADLSVEDMTELADKMAFCAEVSANWMETGGDVAKQPRCLRRDYNKGLAELLINEKDSIQNRAVMTIILTLLAGFACSFLVAAPAIPAQRIQERTTIALLIVASLVAVATMAGLIWTLAYNSWGFIEFGRTYNYGGPELLPEWTQAAYGTRVWEELSPGQQRWHWLRDFLSFEYDPGAPNSADKPGHRFGVLGIFFGTFAIGILALLVAMPMGLLSAIYLSQFAPKRIRDWVKPVLEILAGIPTIVYGFFALITVGPLLADFFGSFGYKNGYLAAASIILIAVFLLAFRLLKLTKLGSIKWIRPLISVPVYVFILLGVLATFDNIAAGDYAVSRRLYFYIKNAHLDVIPGLYDFVEFYMDDRFIGEQGELISVGLIPLPAEERAAEQNKLLDL